MTPLAFIHSDGEGILRLDFNHDSRKLQAVRQDGTISHALEPTFATVADAEDYIHASYDTHNWGMEWIEGRSAQ